MFVRGHHVERGVRPFAIEIAEVIEEGEIFRVTRKGGKTQEIVLPAKILPIGIFTQMLTTSSPRKTKRV